MNPDTKNLIKFSNFIKRSCKQCVLASCTQFKTQGQYLFKSLSKNQFNVERLTKRRCLAKPHMWLCTFALQEMTDTSKTSLLCRLQVQTLHNATSPVSKIHPFSKIAVTFEPIQQFVCPSRFRISKNNVNIVCFINGDII